MDDPQYFLLKESIRLTRTSVIKHLISAGIMSVAAGLQWLLWPIVQPAPFILFYPAVVLASVYGHGVTAIILAALAGQYFFVLPTFSLAIIWPSGVIRQILFLFSAFMIRFIAKALSAALAQAKLDRENAEREKDRAQELASQAMEAEIRLATTLASIGDAVIATSREGRVTFMNPVAEALTEWTMGEAKGKRLDQVFNIINQQSRKPVESPVKRVLGSGSIVGLAHHTVIIGRNGKETVIEDSAAPIRTSDDGPIQGVVLVFRDITEQNRAAEILKDQRDLMQTITDNTTSGLFMMDRKGHPTFMNPAAARMTGYSSLEEIQDRPLHFAIHGKKPNGSPYPIEECPIDNARAKLKPVQNQEENFCTKEGVLFPVSYSVAPLQKDGEFIGSVLEFKDVTAQKLSEKALRSSEEKARIALAAGKMGDWDLDLQTGQARRSLRHDQCFGYEEPLPSWTYEDFIRHVHPEDREEVDRKFKEAISEGKDWDFESRVIWPDRSVHWIKASGRATRDEGNRPIRMAGLVYDITDRKVAEQERERILEQELKAKAEAQASLNKLDAVVHNLTEGLVFADPQGALLLMNPEALRIHQFESPEAMIRGLSDYPDLFQLRKLDGAELALEDWPLSRVLRGEKFSEYEVEVYRRDTGRRWIGSYGGAPVYDNQGGLMLAVLTIRDVTRNRKTEHDLREAIRSRDEFLSIASHELKTPLTSLKLQAQMRRRNLQKGKSHAFMPEKLNAMIDSDVRQIERLSRLIEDMLDISRISTGKLTIQKEKFDLCALIQEVLETYLPNFEASGCKVSLVCCDPVYGEWDQYRIEQVAANLLMNALKYSAGHPVQVSVSREGEWARLTVKDEGMGIAKNAQSRIFNRFERAISANEISGLGLGLYISREIVEMHGGTISVESELGKGAIFTVDLPIS